MLITLWFVDCGLVAGAYYFTVSGVLVMWLWFIGWRMKWLWWRGGVGWIVRRGSGLTGVVVVYLMWIMEFGVTVWLFDGGPRVVVVGIAGDSVKSSWFSIIDWSLWWLVDSLFLRLWFDGWLVGWVMNDEWWFVVSVIDDSLFRLRFTCYLLPCSLSLCDSG